MYVSLPFGRGVEAESEGFAENSAFIHTLQWLVLPLLQGNGGSQSNDVYHTTCKASIIKSDLESNTPMQ